jgi:hypothetical protein
MALTPVVGAVPSFASHDAIADSACARSLARVCTDKWEDGNGGVSQLSDFRHACIAPPTGALFAFILFVPRPLSAERPGEEAEAEAASSTALKAE